MNLYQAFKGFVAPYSWKEIVPSSGAEPSGNRGGAAFFRDGTSGLFGLIGGQTQAGTDLTDFWTFDGSTWTQKVVSGLTGVVMPSAYADGSGNVFVSPSSWVQWAGTAAVSKINMTTGAQTTLTGGGTLFTPQYPLGISVDISNRKVYLASGGTFDYTIGIGLGSTVQDPVGNTNLAQGALTVANLARSQESAAVLCPSNNTLYMLAPSKAYSAAWTLDNTCIIKYDLTAHTGWVQETGVTNKAGTVQMPVWQYNGNQMVWCAASSLFYIFCSSPTGLSRVLTYDPSSKVLAELVFSSGPPAYILGAFDGYSTTRSNAGTVVVSGSDFYFCNCASLSSVTNARIWKFSPN